MLKILLNAGKSPNLGFAYDILFMLTIVIYVKIALTWRQSAGVRSIHTSKASQRLHAEDLTISHPQPLSLIKEREGLGMQACGVGMG